MSEKPTTAGTPSSENAPLLPDHHDRICPRCDAQALRRRSDLTETVRMNRFETVILQDLDGYECTACGFQTLDGPSMQRWLQTRLESDVEWFLAQRAYSYSQLLGDPPEDVCPECGGPVPDCIRVHVEGFVRICCTCHEANHCHLCHEQQRLEEKETTVRAGHGQSTKIDLVFRNTFTCRWHTAREDGVVCIQSEYDVCLGRFATALGRELVRRMNRE